MSHFSKDKTELELFISQNFNFEEEDPYNLEIEDEGEFIQIPKLNVSEETDGSQLLTDEQLPSE